MRVVLLISLCALSLRAAPIDFDTRILPFLKDNCIPCHNKTTTKGDLNMETAVLMEKGGENGKGIIPGKGSESLIYQAAAQSWDSEMPPKSNKVGAVALTTAQLTLLKEWIDQGATPSPKRDKVITWEPLPTNVQPIYALAATADGEFAVAARANEISLYHLPTQHLINKLGDPALPQPSLAHRDLIQSLAFSPDGEWLATGSFREVKLWKKQPPAQQANHRQTSHPKLSATQQADHSIKLTQTSTGSLVAHIRSDLPTTLSTRQNQYQATRSSLEVSARSELLKRAETLLAEQTTRLKKAHELLTQAKQNLAKQKLANPIKKSPTQSPTPAPGTEAALQAAQTAVADAESEIQNVTSSEQKAKQALAEAKASLASAQVAATQATAALQKPGPAMQKARTLQFSANGLELIATLEDGSLRAWSTLNGAPITPGGTAITWKLFRRLGTGEGRSLISDRANSLSFSPDGQTLAVGSGEPSRSGDITLWKMTTGSLTRTLAEHHLDSVLALDFSPDGKLLASGGADKVLRVTDVQSGKILKNFEGHTHHVLSLAWRADGRVLSSAGADNVVKIWDWTTGERRKNVDGWDKEVTAIRYLGATDQMATSAGDPQVRLLRTEGTELKKLAGASSFLHSLCATQNGERILAGDQQGILRLWDSSTGQELATFLAK